MKRITDTSFDVVVLGSGLAGTFTASILARQGHRVLILDQGVHPRFAIGESTIPQTSIFIEMMSRKFDVPELSYLGNKSPMGIRDHVAPTSGVKRTVAFAFHELDAEHDPRHAHHFGNVWRTENHIFRQDVDAWLVTVALKYGCSIQQGVRVKHLDFDADGADIYLDDERSYRARFVVDATGFRSVLADKFGLRETPTRLEHHSRSMFTHVMGLKELEDVSESFMSNRFAEGTTHHVFKRGWFWLIPFNNWEASPNPLASVGLTLDERVYPQDPDLSAEEEFVSFLDRVPTVKAMFQDAVVVRPWIRSGRIQYSSSSCTGDRWAMLSHAAGFVDPLYSRGIISTVESIDILCEVLLEALDDDRFERERFSCVDEHDRRVLSFADRVVRASYISWDDFSLWNLWVRIWAAGTHVIESNLASVLLMGAHSKVKRVEDHVVSEVEDSDFRRVFEAGYSVLDRYDRGDLPLEKAREELEALLASYTFRIPLLDNCQGQEWAMMNPDVRDLFLGDKAVHERWVKKGIDPYLCMEQEGAES